MPDSELMPQNPSYEQNLCYTAREDRNFVNSLICSEGVAGLTNTSLNPFKVNAVVGTSLDVTVEPGRAFIDSDSSSHGMYQVWSSSQVTLTLDANSTNQVYARVYSTEQGDAGGTRWQLETTTASLPLPMDRCLLLATVVTNSNDVVSVVDRRVPAENCGSTPATDFVSYTTPGVYGPGSGGFDPEDYPGASTFIVEVVGGGGGSGATFNNSGGPLSSGGGGGGGYAKSFIDASSLYGNGIVTVTVGAGGTAGLAAGLVPGGTGGTSSFGSLVVAGGGGGGTSTQSTAGLTAGGSRGIASAGDILIDGSNGGLGSRAGSGPNAVGLPTGVGGASFLSGTVNPANDAAGTPGSKWGGGAGGVCNTEFSRTGGAGADGAVFIQIVY